MKQRSDTRAARQNKLFKRLQLFQALIDGLLKSAYVLCRDSRNSYVHRTCEVRSQHEELILNIAQQLIELCVVILGAHQSKY